MTARMLVTGGSGLVGKALVARALAAGYRVRVSTRQALVSTTPGLDYVQGGALSGATDWSGALAGVTQVVHCAARVHVMDERADDPLAAFRAANTDGTLALARQAAAAGVTRFVFISSIKVNGEASPPQRPFTETDAPAPLDPYGVSKHEAEVGLRALAVATGMEVVIIRPPLVYGPGVRANFAALMRAVQRGLPLPFGAIDNRRSLVALANLADLVMLCLTHPRAANQTFLVSDGRDLSSADLVRALAQAAGVRARLLPVPTSLLRGCARLLGKGAAAERLCGSLQVDIRKARDVLGWTPPVSLEAALKDTVLGNHA